MSIGQKYNFREAGMLVMDPDHSSARLLAEMLCGFGVSNPYIVHDPDEAALLLRTGAVDAAIFTLACRPDPTLETIKNLRATASRPVRFMPIIALTGYAEEAHIAQARDAGANFVVRRPIAPTTLFDRLVWTSRPRLFVESARYHGPDRRFRALGPPRSGERRARPKPIISAPQANLYEI